MKRRFKFHKLSLLLTLSMLVAVVSCFALSASAATEVASGTCGTSVNWTLDSDGVFTVSGEGAMENYMILQRPWYSYKEQITEVVIESGVTKAGNNAFNGCINLIEVRLPDTLSSIGNNTFKGASALSRVEYWGTSHPTIIGSGAFSDCSSLDVIHVPTTYDSDAFGYFPINKSLEVESDPLTYTVAVSANPAEGGAVSGGADYEENTSATVTATANDGYNFVNWTENGIEVSKDAGYTFTVNGNRSLVANFEKASFAEITDYTLSLKGNIAVNFYVSMSEDIAQDESAYMQFTMADGEVVKIALANAVKDGDEYKFPASVAAKEMTDKIKAKFFYNSGAAYTDEYSCSVKDYADYLIENAESVTEYAAAEELVKAMLRNGAYAQKHFEYNTSSLADADIEEADLSAVTADTLSSFANAEVQGTDKAKLDSTALLLKSETTLRLFFAVEDGASLSAAYEGAALEVNERDGLYYVDIENISAKDLDEDITVVINDGENTAEITSNPMTYCYNVLAASGMFEQDLTDLVKALYLYNQAANDYFGN